MNLFTLKSLQSRIREATGADRELDFAICKALGRAPVDAIWEVDENLPPEIAAHYKRGWTTPAYVEHRREYKRGIEAAFAKTCSDAERAAEIKALDKEWDFKNSPPFGNVPDFTSDPDGLGPCVALMREVLPGCDYGIGCDAGDDEHEAFSQAYVGRRIDGGSVVSMGKSAYDTPSLAMLQAIISAKIAELESEQEKERVG